MKTKMPDRSTVYPYACGDAFRGKSQRSVFTHIARHRVWGDPDSISGPGANRSQSAHITSVLPALLQHFGVRRLLDVPCGDFQWMQYVNLSGIRYEGGDIVADLIESNRLTYGGKHVSFRHLDLTSDDLGSHDMLLCRDCLVHFSFADIWRALANIRQRDIRYVALTTFTQQETNRDVVTGGWRPLNFERPPFCFPPPAHLLNERCTEHDGLFADKCLGIWRADDLSIHPNSIA